MDFIKLNLKFFVLLNKKGKINYEKRKNSNMQLTGYFDSKTRNSCCQELPINKYGVTSKRNQYKIDSYGELTETEHA